MACSLHSLFHLAPTATNFEPDLFTRILPTLHQEDALVISLYIRTGHTDVKANKEKAGQKTAAEAPISAKNKADKIITCALGLEQDYLANNNNTMNKYQKVVWTVVTDSQYVKQYVLEHYDSRHANTTIGIPRQVVTTNSRGVHSRASRDPSTADFAEALIDWYLIGESDLVIADQIMSPSFGDTAALRTARPLYKTSPVYKNIGNPPTCEKPRLFDAMPHKPQSGGLKKEKGRK